MRINIPFFPAKQRDYQWCWAASIQMVLNYYNVNIQQEQIVHRTYGGRVSMPGSFETITANLNNWSIDNGGRFYNVTALLCLGAPRPDILINELGKGQPIIIAYKPDQYNGHVSVVTGVDFSGLPQAPVIELVRLIDPNMGFVQYPGYGIAPLIDAHWYIKVW
ncbi:papain-like cysteine protease family protein [Nostoc sp.]|uniref:papain-like cysteine protease family protein n=1 Tax=Nostoc sp. TaxID=1180 RepID=UPI002FFC09A2